MGDIMTKGEIAKNLFLQGYNCAQAVVGAFCEDYGYDMQTATKLVSGFGGGMGRLREVCGAVSGMFFVLNMVYGYNDPKADAEKKALYSRIQQLAHSFEEENGSIICKELLGLTHRSTPTPDKRNEAYYKKRPCAELVKFAADLLCEYLENNK